MGTEEKMFAVGECACSWRLFKYVLVTNDLIWTPYFIGVLKLVDPTGLNTLRHVENTCNTTKALDDTCDLLSLFCIRRLIDASILASELWFSP